LPVEPGIAPDRAKPSSKTIKKKHQKHKCVTTKTKSSTTTTTQPKKKIEKKKIEGSSPLHEAKPFGQDGM
jgi:hypothetical protein